MRRAMRFLGMLLLVGTVSIRVAAAAAQVADINEYFNELDRIIAEGTDEEYVDFVLSNVEFSIQAVDAFKAMAEDEPENAQMWLDYAANMEAVLGDKYSTPGQDPCLAMHDMGRTLFDQGDAAGAIAKFIEARECWLQDTGGKETADTATCLNNIGYISAAVGDYDTAIEYYGKALAARKELYGDVHEEVAAVYLNLAEMYESLGMYRDALENQLAALDQREQLMGPDSMEAAVSLNDVAGLYRELGEQDKAIEYYDATLDILKPMYGEDHDHVASLYISKGHVYQEMARYQDALQQFETALDMKIAIHGENHGDVATILTSIGGVYDSLGKFDDALTQYEKALAISLEVNGEVHGDTAVVYSHIGSTYTHLSQYAEALDYLNKALEIEKQVYGPEHPQTAMRYNNIGRVYDALGKFDLATQNYEKALAITVAAYGEQHPDTALAYNNLGLVYKKRGKYDKAQEMYEKAIRGALEVFGEQHTYTGVFYDNYGNLYDARGEYEKGIEYHIKAADIFRAVLGEGSGDEAIAYNNIGADYDMLEEYDKSVDYYLRAIEISEKIYGENHHELGIMYDNVGGVLLKAGDPEMALEYHEKALNIFRNLVGEEHPDTAAAYNNIAVVSDSAGDYDGAIENFTKALEIWLKVFGKETPVVARVYNNIGRAYLGKQDYKKAAENFVLALESQCADGDSTNAANCRPEEDTVTSFHLAGQAFNKLGQLSEAAGAYQNAADSLDMLRGALESELSKKHFSQKFYDMFPEGVGVFAALAREQNAPEHYNSAFQLAEQGIGRVFLEMLGRSQAVVNGGLPQDVILEGATLNAQLQAALDDVEKEISKPRAEQSQESRRAAYERLHHAQKQLDDYEQKLLRDYPAYADLMHPTPRPLSDIRSTVIGENEAALEYILGNDASYLLFITRDDMHVAKLAGRDRIENQIKVFRNKLTDKNADMGRFYRSAARLYDELLSPVEEYLQGIDSLLIVPTGQLYFLPFESLAVETEGGEEFLLKHYNIRYAPSLNVLYLSQQAGAGGREGTGWIGFGDPVYAMDDPRITDEVTAATTEAGGTRSLVDKFLEAEFRGMSSIPRIPGTGEEVRTIATVVDAEGASQDNVHLGLEANEELVKKEIPGGYEIIHLASHGTLGAGEGFEPALILSTVGNTEGEDGFLQMSEVFNMKVPADLVVLSACETGRGKLEKGEGVAGMSRAFLYAGARGMIVSLWSVADKETKELMVRFYEKIRKGTPRETALRMAKQEMLDQGLHPFFWAPFIFIGLN